MIALFDGLVTNVDSGTEVLLLIESISPAIRLIHCKPPHLFQGLGGSEAELVGSHAKNGTMFLMEFQEDLVLLSRPPNVGNPKRREVSCYMRGGYLGEW